LEIFFNGKNYVLILKKMSYTPFYFLTISSGHPAAIHAAYVIF
jgi:hypothetical protein